MRHSALLLAVPFLILTSSLSAQAPDQGGFLIRLGNDTVAAERFTRTPTRLEGEVMSRSPETRLTHYVATLGPGSRITHYQSEMRVARTGLTGPAVVTSDITVAGDTAIVQLTTPQGSRTHKVPVRPGAVPMPPLTFAFYEQMVRQARAEHRDTLRVDMVFPQAPTATQTRLIMRGDSAIVDLFGLPAYAKLDNMGHVLDLDGRQTTDKVMVTRVNNVDTRALAQMFGAREAGTGAMGQLSPRDTAHAMFGDAMMMVDYGRPHQRGRVVFGGIVPWNEVWRTGANAATQLITNHDLVIAGTTIPAGTYTLWTVPTPDGATLIINRQHGQWGTEYDASQNFARFPMMRTTLADSLEQFTISIDPAAGGGTLQLRWENTQYSLPFTVK